MTVTQEERLADLARAMGDVDRATMQLIVDELGEAWPALEDSEVKAAAVLREALAAVETPERAVADLNAEIAHAEAELATWRKQLADGDVAARVTARTWIAEWEAEVAALTAKRDYAQAGMLPLIAARTRARADLELVQGAKNGLAVSMLDPYGPVGQGTTAYVSYRMPRLAYVLLAADRAHPEWEVACTELRELCISAMRGGYNVAADLPDYAEVAFRAMTAEMASALDSAADPAPSAVELKALETAYYEDAALQGRPVHVSDIDDRRFAQPVRTPVPQRDYMSVPRLRDVLGG